MFSYLVSWTNFVYYNLPVHLRKIYRIKWIELLIYESTQLYNTFITTRTNVIYKVSHTNSKISIEKVLNDEFDPVNQEIYIELIQEIDQQYLHVKSESQPIYLYTKWDAATAYVIGDYANYGGYTWECIQAHTNEIPADGSSYWTKGDERTYLYESSEYGGNGFIVFVPVSLTYDSAHMNSLIQYYKLAGIYYEIQTYTP